MNKRQLEVAKVKLAEEKKTLSNLRRTYAQAEKDIDKQLQKLQKDIDKITVKHKDDLNSEAVQSMLRSKVLQQNYQNQLKKQIDTVIDTMNTSQARVINDYLKQAYNTGYIGTAYDLHGQGVPFFKAINPATVAAATKLDSKVSKTLYGNYTNQLKGRIRAEVSRGISTAMSYSDIARNINGQMNVGLNNSMRIARTEGHKIQQEATFKAQHDAKDAGADIVKQWDASLDGRTRATHRALDGRIKELDESFIDGKAVPMYPSNFGDPAEDINCRCALLQRARWELDESELEELRKRAEFFELDEDPDKIKDIRDFEVKFSKAEEVHEVTVSLLQEATKAEPAITKELKRIVGSTNGTIDYNVGKGKTALDFRLKEFDSLNRKVISDYVKNGKSLPYISTHTYDVVRYTCLNSPNNLVEDYFKIEKRLNANGYKIVRVKNTLGNKEEAYRGLNTVVQSPTGYKFELQFHTQESMEIKERIHKLYEVQRLDSTSSEEKERLKNEMKAISQSLHKVVNIGQIMSFNSIQ